MKTQFSSEYLSDKVANSIDSLVLQEIRRQLDSNKISQKVFITVTPNNDLSVNLQIKDLSGKELFHDWVYSINKVTKEHDYVCYIKDDNRYFVTLEETLVF